MPGLSPALSRYGCENEGSNGGLLLAYLRKEYDSLSLSAFGVLQRASLGGSLESSLFLSFSFFFFGSLVVIDCVI